jgi:hypothetical protein
MSENDHPERPGLRAVLFPHSGLSEEGARRILSFFETLILFLPWYMEPPEIAQGKAGVARAVYPPEHLKPIPGFKGLLSECKSWMTHNYLKGYTPLLRARLAGRQDEPTTQEIREALRPGEKGEPIQGPDEFTKWHLVLHLNRSMEEQEEEATGILSALRQGNSPLKGVVEEEAVEGLFDDLPPSEPSPLAGPQDLEPVCEAWFGLFGGALGKQDPLVTLNSRLLPYLSDRWEERYGEGCLNKYSATWLWPDLSGIGLDALARERRRVFQDEKAGALICALRDIPKDPVEGHSRLKAASAGLCGSWVQQFSPRVLRLTMTCFPCISEENPDPKGRTLANIQDRAIVLVEQVSPHEKA